MPNARFQARLEAGATSGADAVRRRLQTLVRLGWATLSAAHEAHPLLSLLGSPSYTGRSKTAMTFARRPSAKFRSILANILSRSVATRTPRPRVGGPSPAGASSDPEARRVCACATACAVVSYHARSWKPLATRRRRHSSGVSDHRVRAAGITAHRITSFAWKRMLGGIVRPSACAVFRLITSSNLVGCSTGSSAGFVPLRILSTKTAACRNESRRFGP